jgi:hypothetical protein
MRFSPECFDCKLFRDLVDDLLEEKDFAVTSLSELFLKHIIIDC